MSTPPDILIIGESIMDIVSRGGETHEHPGGSPANVALGLARRGLPVWFLSQIGTDARGTQIREHLEASGVQILAESFIAGNTSTARATIAADGAAEYDFDVVWDLPSLTVPARVVHLGSVAAFIEPGASAVREIVQASGAEIVTFDPNIRPALIGSRVDAVRQYEAALALSTLVKMSDEDAEWLYPDRSPEYVLDAVLAGGARVAAITLGGEGAILAAPGATVRVDPEVTKVADTIGAGDTFMASLVASAAHEGVAETAEVLQRWGQDAGRAAAITVSRAGADLPWGHEL